MTELRTEAEEILRALTGQPAAEFHDGQWEAIEALVAQRRRALVVERTGWGKSAVYFIAALLRRRQGCGPALIVSPLLALMRDQVEAAGRAGVRAASINSANPTEWADVAARLNADAVDVLLISPERLVNQRFKTNQLPALLRAVGLVVIDEAHCISDWGHDFRPDYRRIRDLLADLPPDTPVLATTATANARVIADIEEQIALRAPPDAVNSAPSRVIAAGEEQIATPDARVYTVRGALARASLRLGVLRLDADWQRLAWLAEHLDEFPGSGIIYCLTVAGAEDTASLLARAGHRVLAYTGRTDDAERRAAEAALKGNDVQALVATSALGMGFDKPDLGFVVHLGAPASPVAYYQQVGRAGRATTNADVLLLPGSQDRAIWEFFATSSMPTRETADEVLTALAASPAPLSIPALEARVNVRRSRLELLLKVLAVDGAVERTAAGWGRTGQPWRYDEARYDRITRARQREQDAMERYESLTTCRMEYLTRALDDPHAAPCGRCDVCAGPWYPTAISPVRQRQARDQLDRAGVAVEPRSRWPTGLDRLGVGGDGAPLQGAIPVDQRVKTGRVIARLTDLGWGTRLRRLLHPDAEGRPSDATVPPELVPTCLAVLRDWDWPARPAGVVWLPSLSRPRLIESLATGIARAGKLEALGPLDLAPGAGPTPPSGNSAYRVRDVWDRFTVPADLAARLAHLGGPVLLVDDIIDSRWTVMIAGALLRRAGATGVLPFALASVA